LALGILAILYGFALGVVFGVAEDGIEGGLRASAEARIELYRAEHTAAPQPAEATRAEMKRVQDGAWKYFIRAHLHAGAIGAVAVGLSLILAFLTAGARLKGVAAWLLGVGAVGYPLFWMLAAIRAPGLGSTRAAKESLTWLAVPTAGAAVVGVILTLVLVLYELYVSRSGGPEEANRWPPNGGDGTTQVAGEPGRGSCVAPSPGSPSWALRSGWHQGPGAPGTGPQKPHNLARPRPL
jgi:hypothetical protein